jgi:hypothetical protein
MSVNCGLCYLFKEHDASVMMKAERMRRLGHFIRLNEAALPQRYMFAESWSHQNQGDRNYDSQSVRQTIWQMLVLRTEEGELKTEIKNDGKKHLRSHSPFRDVNLLPIMDMDQGRLCVY